jgi:hypothetical protein
MRYILCLIAAGFLTAFVMATPAAAQGTGLNPPPTMEVINGSSLMPPFSSSITCQDIANGTATYTISGTAEGPYPGTFTETGTIVLTGGVVTSFSATFTITSGPTTLQGTKSGPITFRGSSQCDAPSPDFGPDTNFFHAGPFDARYALTITGPLGTNDYTGPVQNDFNFSSGAFVSGGSQEVFLPPDEPPPAPCLIDDDDDHDGLIASREGLFLSLPFNADSDGDRIKDGNDDANHNRVDDEDEDDANNPCELDEDHDGTDDEDEDD